MANNKKGINPRKMEDFSYALRTLGLNIRNNRKDRGFTYEALAEFLGISTAYVGLIERGERCPSLETFLRICEFFGTTAEKMLDPGPLNMAEPTVGSIKDVEDKKRKTIASITSTFNDAELEYVVNFLKSFKAFSIFQEKAMS